MNALTIIAGLVLALWWYKPLRVFLVQRTNRTVKVLLILFPALFIGRAIYGVFNGDVDTQWLIVAATVFGLLLLWAFLVWLGNWLERRRPTQVQGPDFAALAKLPGMPRIPGGAQQAAQVLANPELQRAAQMAAPHLQRAAQAAAPQLQRAARAAAEAAAGFDTGDLAGSAGRTTGRLYAKLRKNFKEGSATSGTAPTPAP